MGIALLTTYLTRRAQSYQVLQVSHLTPWDFTYRQRLHEIGSYLGNHLAHPETGRHAQRLIYDSLLKQSQLLSFVSSFRLLAIISLFCITGALLMKRVRPRGRISSH